MKKKFYPVIHCVNPHSRGGIGHALRNTQIAVDNGADGVFLIGHKLAHVDLFYIYQFVRKQFPHTWIGLNFLDIPAVRIDLLNIYTKPGDQVNALWFDELPSQHFTAPESTELFGGIAFKYRNPNAGDLELAKECEEVIHRATTATTSGNKTGEPPSLEKLEKIKALLNDRIPLALASGVNAGNAVSFKPCIDSFLAASSITERDPYYGNHEYLIPYKTRELADLIHS